MRGGMGGVIVPLGQSVVGLPHASLVDKSSAVPGVPLRLTPQQMLGARLGLRGNDLDPLGLTGRISAIIGAGYLITTKDIAFDPTTREELNALPSVDRSRQTEPMARGAPLVIRPGPTADPDEQLKMAADRMDRLNGGAAAAMAREQTMTDDAARVTRTDDALDGLVEDQKGMRHAAFRGGGGQAEMNQKAVGRAGLGLLPLLVIGGVAVWLFMQGGPRQ